MNPHLLKRAALTLLAAVTLLSASPAGAQTGLAPTTSEPGEELTVYIMTMGPGAAVWERFGHNAIWVRDRLRGTDIAYNWGMFSFDQENFILRFVRGEMDYWMEGFDAGAMANFYVQQGRSVWAQELNLTPTERAELRDFLEWNSRPENRFYRYDYYRDNCSTRVRDAIDRVLGGQIRAQTDSVLSGTTYRDHTRRLTATDPLLYTGLMIGLGQPVDREISLWDEMFLPMRLRDLARDITIEGPGGARLPLIRSEEEIFVAPVVSGSLDRSARIGGYLFCGAMVGLCLLATAYFRDRRRDAAVAFRVVSTGWTIVAGVLGLVLAILWGWTDHVAAYRNENLLLFNPLVFVLALMLPFASDRRPRLVTAAAWIALMVAIGAMFAMIVGIAPSLFQENGEVIALALPPHIALAVSLWMWRIRIHGGTLLSLPWKRPPASV